MTNAQLSPAVAVARQVLAKTFKRQISSKTATAAHNNVSSASQEDEKGRYALWTSVRNSSEKRTYRTHIKTSPVVLTSVTIVQKRDTRPKTPRHIPVLPARRSLEAMVCFKVKTSSERRKAELRSAKVAFSNDLDEVR